MFSFLRRENISTPDIKIDDSWVTIKSLDFFGAYNKSPNGEYIVAWASGEGNKKNGKYVILNQHKLIFQGKLPRPKKAFISNKGTFLILDSRFTNWKEGISRSTVFVFDHLGACLFKKEPKSLFYSGDISPDGEYAVFVTAGGNAKDANTLFFIDIGKGEITWKGMGGYPDRFSFDTSSKIIHVIRDGRGSAQPDQRRYSFEGKLLE